MENLTLMAELSAALRGLLEEFSLDNDATHVRDAMRRRLAAQRRARAALNRADEVLHLAATMPPGQAER